MFDWLYLGMLPFVHWDGESGALAVEQVAGPAGLISIGDLAGTSPAQISLGATARLGLVGRALTGDLRYGCQVVATGIAGNLVGPVSTFPRPNIEASAAAGPLDWTAKAYFAADLPAGTVMQAGDVIGFSSHHVLAVTPVQA